MPAPHPSILLVEDDPDTRDAIQEVLSGAGHRVAAVASGKGALAWLADYGRPALLLLDFHLPDTDGAALLARLPESEDIAVVAISASPISHPRVAAVLFKPFGLEDLLAVVERHAR